MICIKCKIDKELTEFTFRKCRGKYITKCKRCVNLDLRIKRNGGEPVNEFVHRKTGRKPSTCKLTSYAVKLHRIIRCDYKLCRCAIEEGQKVYERKNYGTIRKYCSEWCKEVAEIDIKLGLNAYEI